MIRNKDFLLFVGFFILIFSIVLYASFESFDSVYAHQAIQLGNEQSKNVKVIEHYRCIYESEERVQSSEEEPISTKPLVSCVGIEMFRFIRPDGSSYGTFFAVRIQDGYVHDPTKWEKVE